MIEEDNALTDEELRAYLLKADYLGLDGVWSAQSKAIKKALGSSAFDMSKWWTLTSPDWTCEGCGRSKPHIARITTRGEIMCHLVEHHDHMDRYIDKQLAYVVAGMAEFVATVESDRFAERSASAVAAFDPIVICEDCNNADAAAKKLVGAHVDFSFTAADLRKFVVARPNEPHEIDEAKLQSVWAFRREQLTKRFALAEHIVKLAATNSQWYEIADPFHHPNRIETRAKGALAMLGDHGPLIAIDRFIALSAPKPTRTADKRKWREARRKAIQSAPSEKELEWLKVKRIDAWTFVPDDWCCAWCRRAKIETVRAAKAAGWAFNVHQSWKKDARSGQLTKQLICQDCQDTRQCLAKEVGCSSADITAEEVIAVLRPRANAPHDLVPDHQIDIVVGTAEARIRAG